MRDTIRMLAAAALALSACGLLEPEGPPARVEGDVPGTGTDGPVPRPQSPSDPAAPEEPLPDSPLPGYTLAFRDEFSGTALDDGKWTIREDAWRDAQNAADSLEVGGGVLTFITFTDATGVHHAGHINTGDKFEARYGYWETRARFGDSFGQWCSFFIWANTIGNPIGDPGNAGVEVDIYEHRELDGGGWDTHDYVQVGINWDGFGREWKKQNRTVAHPDGAPLKGEWHNYSVLWDPSGYTFYIDEQQVFRTTAAVSHIPEHIYLTCEVRDNTWAGNIPVGGYGSREASTHRMEIDWVRVWTPAQ